MDWPVWIQAVAAVVAAGAAVAGVIVAARRYKNRQEPEGQEE